MKFNHVVFASGLAVFALAPSPALTPARPASFADCTAGKAANDPAFVMAPHSTRGSSLEPGPAYTSPFSYKAVTEAAVRFYGGDRIYNDATIVPGSGRQTCEVSGAVDVRFAISPTSVAHAQLSSASIPTPDLRLWQHCCDPITNPMLTDVETISGVANEWISSIPKNQGGGGTCGCPPQNFSRAAVGYLVLDLTGSLPSEPYEPPEEFGVEYQSAAPDVVIPSGYNYFDIGQTTTGNVWIIQDSCESRSLFTYPPQLPTADVGGPIAVQLATDFALVTGYPTSSACLNVVWPYGYYGEHPYSLKNAAMFHLVNQNWPCAASEVLVEGNHFDLLLGLLDQDTSNGTSVAGSFFEGMNPGDKVVVELIVKYQRNWQTVSGCGNLPSVYPHYAEPETDFTVEVRTAVPGTNCSSGAFSWTRVFPTPPGPTGNKIYTFEFNTVGDFYRKVRGIRVTAVQDDPNLGNEGPEIAHLELLSVTYVPASGAAPTVNLGWSKAFRLAIIDERP